MTIQSVLHQHPRRAWQPGRPRVYYLVAPAGVPNWGDELIAATWLRYLAHAHPHDTVVVDCHNPGKAAVLLRDLHPHLVVTNTLWDLVERAGRRIFPQDKEPIDPTDITTQQLEQLCTLTRTWVLDGGAQADLATNLDLVGSADVLHIVGGGYLNDMWPHHAAIVAAVAAVADRPRPEGEPRPLFVATGAGLMPQRLGVTLPYLLQADVVTVRDAASEAILHHTVNAVTIQQEPSATPTLPEFFTELTPRAEFAKVGDDTWLAVALGIMECATQRQAEERAAAQNRNFCTRLAAKMRCAVQSAHAAHAAYSAHSGRAADGAVDRKAAGEAANSAAFGMPLLEWGCEHLTVADTYNYFPYHPAPEGCTTILCVQSDLVDDKETLWAWLRETLADWKAQGSELLVVECIPYGDYAVWQNVIEQDFPGAQFMPFARLWREGLPVGENVRWLSTRFHPHLLASAAGCAGVAVDAHDGDYYAVKHESVQAAGSLWPIVYPVGLPPQPPTHTCDVSRRETMVRGALDLANAIYCGTTEQC